jgi:hypothetical protein
MSPIEGAAGQSTVSKGRRGRKGSGGGLSLRDHVIAVLEGGAMAKEDVLAAVQKGGYKFSTNNPLNSLGVILYGKNPKFNRTDGKFSLGAAAKARSTPAIANTAPKARGKRKMSSEARARFAAAQRARWAKQKSGK